MTTIRLTDEERSVEADHQISVRSLLSEPSFEDIVETINRVSSLPVESTGCLSFPIVWRRLARPQSPNLVRAVLLAESLDARLDALAVTEGTLVCDSSVDDLYARTAADIVSDTEIEFRREDSAGRLGTMLAFVAVLAKVGFLLVDWVVARVVSAFRDADDPEILYVPALERLGSAHPVMEAMSERPSAAVIDPTTYYYARRDRSPLRSYDVTTVHEALPARGFLGQFRDIATLTREIVTRGPFTDAVTAAVEDEFGVALGRTVGGLLRETIADFRLVRALLLRRSLRALFAEREPASVVFGTLDPTGRAIVREALAADIDVYHIPHSIATTHPPNPETPVTQFLSGEMDVRYYERVIPPERRWNWVPLGRPYLSDLAETYRDRERPGDDDAVRVVVAPPARPAWVREAFIVDVLDALDAPRFEATVKPHPDDDDEFYRDVARDYDGVRVVSDGLYEEILAADLTVNLSSNVGLESMVIGTPTLCYNAWNPLVLDQTYAFADEVPVVESRDALAEWTAGRDADALESLAATQRRFVAENYRLDPNVVDDIARYIESGGDPSE